MQTIINIVMFIGLADLSGRFTQLDKFAFGLANDLGKLIALNKKSK